MMDYRYDTQLLIEGTGLDEDEIHDHILARFAGDCLLVAGDEDLVKLHFHTNKPWEILNTAPPWARSSTLWWRTWTARPAA